jgi:manganese transport protein
MYTIIHVVESAAARYLGKNTMDYETHLDSNSLEKYQTKLKELGYEADVKIGFGNAANEITKLISSRDIDLLVMGAHGHKGFKDLIFGTTVDSVRHKIKIPLLVVN